jgi:hypothetical protein
MIFTLLLAFQDSVPDLIRNLGADEFHVREEAEKKLLAIGKPALEELRKAARDSDDPEVRMRAQAILDELEWHILAGEGKSYESRFGGKRLCVAKGGGGKDTEEAVLNALRWLARHQNKDGSWSATKHVGECGKIPAFRGACAPNPGSEDHDVGLSGLALMAFLGSGYTQESKDIYDGICYGDVVKKGLDRLAQIQHETGRVGSDKPPKYMYNHFLASCALADAFGITRDEGLKKTTGRAIEYIVKAQNPGKGWRYTFQPGDNDSSATGWAVHALHSAERAGFKVPESAWQGAIAWIDEATEKSYQRVGYTDRRIGKVVIPGVSEHFADHPTLTSMGAASRMFIARKGVGPEVRAGAEHLIADLPEWDARGLKVDMYYWFHASTAMFQFDGPSGPFWKKWNERMKAVLLEKQNRTKGDCRHGSWEPVDRWSSEGGRVYTTAMGALTLEVYYRIPSVFMKK